MPHVERKYTTFLYAKWKICNKSEMSRKSADSAGIFTQQVSMHKLTLFRDSKGLALRLDLVVTNVSKFRRTVTVNGLYSDNL